VLRRRDRHVENILAEFFQKSYNYFFFTTAQGKPMGRAIILPPTKHHHADQSRMTGSAIRPGDYWQRTYNRVWVDSHLFDAISTIRHMDAVDPRVKQVHSTIATYITKGGLELFGAEKNPRITAIWQKFKRRLRLDSIPKIYSDARQFALCGNLALEVLVREDHVVGLPSLPAETIVPHVDTRGRIKSAERAYIQWNTDTGTEQAQFSLAGLILARLDSPNYDDHAAMGRPVLDSSREAWEKLRFSEEMLVKRRASRASLRLSHVLEGATAEQLDEYKLQVEAHQYAGHDTDYYLNRKGSVTAIQGDASLSDIADIKYLMDVFFAAAPAPSGIFGFGHELSRDVLQELMALFFNKVDVYQEYLAAAYQEAFEIQLALSGIDPREEYFTLEYIESRTTTPTQRADIALKLQALGFPRSSVIREAGFSPADIQSLIRAEAADQEALAPPSAIISGNGRVIQPKVTISPEAAGRGHSRTDISN
jgi:hypothetical protein